MQSFYNQSMKIGEIEIDENTFLEKVRDTQEQRLRYAGCWEGGKKPVKERAIVCDFLRSQEAQDGQERIFAVRANPSIDVAPDCFGITKTGIIGYEVTELVDEETIIRNLRRKDGGRVIYKLKEWQPDEVTRKVQAILRQKDSRDFKGADFEQIVLIIHTGELGLRPGDFSNLLLSHKFSRCDKINEYYL